MDLLGALDVVACNGAKTAKLSDEGYLLSNNGGCIIRAPVDINLDAQIDIQKAKKLLKLKQNTDLAITRSDSFLEFSSADYMVNVGASLNKGADFNPTYETIFEFNTHNFMNYFHLFSKFGLPIFVSNNCFIGSNQQAVVQMRADEFEFDEEFDLPTGFSKIWLKLAKKVLKNTSIISKFSQTNDHLIFLFEGGVELFVEKHEPQKTDYESFFEWDGDVLELDFRFVGGLRQMLSLCGGDTICFGEGRVTCGSDVFKISTPFNGLNLYTSGVELLCSVNDWGGFYRNRYGLVVVADDCRMVIGNHEEDDQ